MPRGLKDLLNQAYKRTSELYLNDCENGETELIWLRRYTWHMSSVQTLYGDSPKALLQSMMAVEDAIERRVSHGESCACDDCCIDRVDRERRKRE